MTDKNLAAITFLGLRLLFGAYGFDFGFVPNIQYTIMVERLVLICTPRSKRTRVTENDFADNSATKVSKLNP